MLADVWRGLEVAARPWLWMTSQDGHMFRITSHIAGDEIVLKVEGCLIGDWVAELDACWKGAAGWPSQPRIRVDLSDVCHVDDAGRALMTAMYRAGAHFVTKGCVMPEVVREIAEAGQRSSEPGARLPEDAARRADCRRLSQGGRK